VSRERDIGLELEALIFASPGPLSPTQIRRALPRLTPSKIAELVTQINESLLAGGRPYEIGQVAGGYQFRTRPEYGDLILSGQPERRVRLSRAALETLSIVAYRQPITRPEIEQLRCVDCGGVMKNLLDRGLIRIVGRRDAPGRPPLYGTAAAFLEAFGLNNLSDLPELREFAEMDQEEGTPLEEALDQGGTDGGEEAEGEAQA